MIIVLVLELVGVFFFFLSDSSCSVRYGIGGGGVREGRSRLERWTMEVEKGQ